jgi:hypothetical protein
VPKALRNYGKPKIPVFLMGGEDCTPIGKDERWWGCGNGNEWISSLLVVPLKKAATLSSTPVRYSL